MNRSYSFTDSTAQPTVHFSDIPPDIVQNVQVAQARAQARAMAETAPAANTEVFFSEVPPDVTQPVQVVATAGALSASAPATPAPAAPTSDLASSVTQLRGRGVAEEEIREFLKQIGSSYTFAMDATQEGVNVTLPSANLLTPAQRELLLAAISTELSAANPALAQLIRPMIDLLPEIANRLNVSIGIGPTPSGAAGAGASFGSGLLFGPGNRMGFFGSLSGVVGAIVSISGSIQVTILHGGPEVFGGTAVAATIGGGEGVVGSATALLSQGRFIGVTFAMGVGAGVAPIEAYAQYQYTPTTLGLIRPFRG